MHFDLVTPILINIKNFIGHVKQLFVSKHQAKYTIEMYKVRTPWRNQTSASYEAIPTERTQSFKIP